MTTNAPIPIAPRAVPIVDLSTLPMRFTYYLVPAGTRVAYCRGPHCRRPMYWITSNGKKCIDCNVTGGQLPSINAPGQIDAFVETEATRGAPARDGKGVLHFLTCQDAALFAREKAARR